MTSWDETLSDNGIMMREGEAAKALALGVSEKVTLSGSTESFAVLGMCSTVGQKVEHAFCDALDTAISVLAPCFEDSNGDVYPSDLSALAVKAGIDTVVYGATTGEIRLKNAGAMFDSTYIYQRKLMLNLMVTVHQEEEPVVVTPITVYSGERLVNTGYLGVDDSELEGQGVTWTSSDPSIATIDSSTGFVTVVSDGTCTFTATGVADNTKVGASTVSCLKITDDNMASNIAVSAGTSSITVSGVTITNKGDGTFELNGTVSSTASTNYNLGPLATSKNTVFNYFLPITIDGDVLVWFEHLSGTVSEASTLTGKDFEVQVYDLNNSKISDYSLNYQEYPTSNGESQCKLITGSTAGIKRFNIASKRPANTVFTNYVIRVGIKKLSQNGLVYSGGVIESSLPAVYSYPALERLKFGRMPDGSISMYVTTSGNYWPAQSGCVRLTTSIIYQSSSGDLLTGNAIAPSGKTYKFTLRMLEALSFSAATELSFVVKGVAGTEQAKITVLSNNAQTNALDANGVGEVTFTATEGVDAVYFYYNKVSLSDQKMHFAVSLTEVMT